MQKTELSSADKEQPIEVVSPPEPSMPPAIRQKQQTSQYLDSGKFLDSFQHEISPTAIISVEKRPDEAIVVHCNNLYEYLKFGYRKDQTEVAKIEKHKEIFEAFSMPDTVPRAMQLKSQLPEEDQVWLMDKLNAEGSAVPVEYKDGKREAIVMMNDMPTKRMLNHDGTERTEEQIQKYDREYKRTVEHEVRHTQYYNKFGKDLEVWRKTMESLRPLTPFEQRKYHYDRYTKDEIVAHIENEVTEDTNGNTQVNWEGIIQNLQKGDYRFPEVFKSQQDVAEYLKVSTALVIKAKEKYGNIKSPDAIMDTIARIDVQQFMTQA